MTLQYVRAQSTNQTAIARSTHR